MRRTCRACPAVLSRYNSDDLCAPCQERVGRAVFTATAPPPTPESPTLPRARRSRVDRTEVLRWLRATLDKLTARQAELDRDIAAFREVIRYYERHPEPDLVEEVGS